MAADALALSVKIPDALNLKVLIKTQYTYNYETAEKLRVSRREISCLLSYIQTTINPS